MSKEIVLPDFELPEAYVDGRFVFEPLGSKHNAVDQPAWTSSIDHIRATPGFAGRRWPAQKETLKQNEASLARHEADFGGRRGFAYAVLDAVSREYLGCVYFYPPRSGAFDVDVRSWVRRERADLDKPLRDAVRAWLKVAWPWTRPDCAER